MFQSLNEAFAATQPWLARVREVVEAILKINTPQGNDDTRRPNYQCPPNYNTQGGRKHNAMMQTTHEEKNFHTTITTSNEPRGATQETTPGVSTTPGTETRQGTQPRDTHTKPTKRTHHPKNKTHRGNHQKLSNPQDISSHHGRLTQKPRSY